MQPLRALLLRNRTLALFVAVAALCLKALIPAGYMVAPEAQVLSVVLCADASGQPIAHDIVLPAKADPGHSAPAPAKAEATCPYSALAMASLAGAAPALLALALLFVLALSFMPVRVRGLAHIAHLRPPLRGPPALV